MSSVLESLEERISVTPEDETMIGVLPVDNSHDVSSSLLVAYK